MKHITPLSQSLLAFSLLLFTACSDSSNNSQKEEQIIDEQTIIENPLTGYFVDSGVAGLAYECSPSGHSGITDINGSYTCEQGESVEFFLGGESLGSVTAQEYITPAVLFQGDEEAALNFAQLIQTLDSDGDPSNGIEINEELLSTLDSPIIFTNPNFDEDIQTQLSESNTTLVDEGNATNHLNDTFVGLDIDKVGADREYKWVESEWGECLGSCGTDNATQTREVTCEDSIGTQDSSKCDADIKPDTTQSCTASECSTTPTPTPTSAPSQAPVFTSNANQSIAEYNALAAQSAPARVSRGTLYYSAFTLTATDANNDDINFTISGGDSVNFDLNSTTGVLRFLNVRPDFETKRNYIFTAKATDENNNSTTQDVNITITDEVDIAHNGIGYGSVVSPFTGKLWADRNLGASQACTAFNDTACYGDYYQWGRNADGHQVSTSSIIDINDTNIIDITNVGHGDFIESYIEYNFDWTGVVDAPDGTVRIAEWSKIDGTSVCPVGFRVPTAIEFDAETITANTPVANQNDAYNNFLKLPSAGYRNARPSAFYDQGSRSMIWSNSDYNSSSVSFNFSLDAANVHANSRGFGFSVRCVQD